VPTAGSAQRATGLDPRIATVITEISAPAVCVVAGMIVVTWLSADTGVAAAWSALAIVLCAGVPMAYVVKGVRAGKWSDHHIGRREQRTVPILVALGSITVATGLLVLVQAPRELVALVLAQMAGLLVVLAITRFWKVSIHCATAAGLVGVFVVLFGPWALLGLAALPLIAWARVTLDAHTWPQVTVGATIGFLIGAGLYPLFL
jgi:membrane-associated phospholipid phosphatase